jgi:hypothetical protein
MCIKQEDGLPQVPDREGLPGEAGEPLPGTRLRQGHHPQALPPQVRGAKTLGDFLPGFESLSTANDYLFAPADQTLKKRLKRAASRKIRSAKK